MCDMTRIDNGTAIKVSTIKKSMITPGFHCMLLNILDLVKKTKSVKQLNI